MSCSLLLADFWAPSGFDTLHISLNVPRCLDPLSEALQPLRVGRRLSPVAHLIFLPPSNPLILSKEYSTADNGALPL